MPKLAFALSPPTDFEAAAAVEGRRTSLVDNEEFDWINRKMLLKWADWYCPPAQYRNPYVSPFYADLRGLAPIYMQAGRVEILYDSIEAFAARAKREAVNVTLESWDGMNHDFQLFGDHAPQSAEALRRLGEVLNSNPADLKENRNA
jgi:acetyl esterase/lipase